VLEVGRTGAPLVLLLAFGVGATIVVTYGSIFAWLRALYEPFFGCALCVGTWIGAGIYLTHQDGFPPVLEISLRTAPDAVLFGALTGTLALIVMRVLGILDRFQ
jgi:hypothetical protein